MSSSLNCSLIIIVVLSSCFLFMPIIMLCHVKKRKNWRYTSPSITPSEKAFKHREAMLPQLLQLLASIIICSRKWYSDTKGKIYLDSLRSELLCFLMVMAFYFMSSAFLIRPTALHMFHCALINTVINFFQITCK